jgi:hypothetical protein
MTELAEVALAFCRECLGWEKVHTFTFGRELWVVRNLSATSDVGDTFNATDLNAVMEAVRGWCDLNDAAVEIGYYDYIPGEWEVHAITPISSEPVQSDNLSRALLAACVEANRKLKP